MYKILYQKGGLYDFKHLYEDESNTFFKTTYGAFIQKYPFSLHRQSLKYLSRIDFIDLHAKGDTFDSFKAFFYQFHLLFLEFFQHFLKDKDIILLVTISNKLEDGKEYDFDYDTSNWTDEQILMVDDERWFNKHGEFRDYNYSFYNYVLYQDTSFMAFDGLKKKVGIKTPITENSLKFLIELKKINLLKLVERSELKYFLAAYCKLKIILEKQYKGQYHDYDVNKLNDLTDYISSYIEIRSEQITSIIEQHIRKYRSKIRNIDEFYNLFNDPYKDLDEIQQKLIIRIYEVYNLVKQLYDDNNVSLLRNFQLRSNLNLEIINLDKIIGSFAGRLTPGILSKNKIYYNILKCNS